MSCATSTDGTTGGAGPEGGGGAAADDDGTGTAGSGAAMTGPGGSGGAGGVLTNCGDGEIEPPETCDGDNLGGKTCETFGLAPGVLQCNDTCQIVVSGCGLVEVCTNDTDDDADGDIDCLDDDCAAAPGCLDSCAATISVPVPTFDTASALGRPNTYTPSCAAGSGSEVVYELVAQETGLLGISVNQRDGDFSVAAMTTCGESATEVGCASNISNQDFPENLQIDVVAGTTYWIAVDAVSANDSTSFELLMLMLSGGESACFDLSDGDADGLIDCNDPDCQTNSTCTDGISPIGSPCTHTGQCTSADADPVCLPGAYGFDDGYCSEFCSLSTDDCPTDAYCYDFGLGADGVCLEACNGDGDCRTGYACLDLGFASRVCYIEPEQSCNNFDDDDFDGHTDCDDPDCQATPACMPGTSGYSQECTTNSQCASNTGDDPLCLRNPPFFFPGGYCSEFCNVASNDCGPGAVCDDFFFLDSATGQCFKRCVNASDCRAGLSCVDHGFGKHCNL